MVGLDDNDQTASPEVSRRRFFGIAGVAAVGTAGTLRFLRREDDSPEQLPLAEAVGPPDGVRLGVRRVIWSVSTDQPIVAFTFDDGPDADLTPRILDVLDRYAIKATFFVVGYNAERRSDLLVEAVARGHEIGNHTWRHVDLSRQRAEEARRSIALGDRAIISALGSTPLYFRPPRGQITGAAMRYAAENGNDIVLWSVGRGIRGPGDPRSVAGHVLGEIGAGDILLLHDGIGREAFRTDLDGPGPLRVRRDVEVRALPAIIEGTLERGLRPVTVSELLAASSPPPT